jgi:hypothetical protein
LWVASCSRTKSILSPRSAASPPRHGSCVHYTCGAISIHVFTHVGCFSALCSFPLSVPSTPNSGLFKNISALMISLCVIGKSPYLILPVLGP